MLFALGLLHSDSQGRIGRPYAAPAPPPRPRREYLRHGPTLSHKNFMSNPLIASGRSSLHRLPGWQSLGLLRRAADLT